MAIDRAKDQADLAAALAIVRQHCPDAVAVNLETSDQNYYGFMLWSIDRPGTLQAPAEDVLPAEAQNQIFDLICDLRWDGVVGEDKHGYARIELSNISETGTPYVPIDYEGPTTACAACGNPAPVRWPNDGADDPGENECSPCFIGRIANELVTLREAQALKAEIENWEKS